MSTAKQTEASKELVANQTQGGAVASFLQGPRTDHTSFDQTDLTIPRIKLAQDLSPEAKDGSVAPGEIFLNLTQEVLGSKTNPMRFVVVIAAKEYIIWQDRLDGGGGLLARARPVRDGDRIRYKWDKPNTEFHTKVKGIFPATWKTAEYVDEDGLDQFGTSIVTDKDSVPAASLHYNYLVILPDHGNMLAAFSLAKSQVKKARALNALIQTGKYNMYARFFKAYVKAEKSPDNPGDFFNYDFKPAGLMTEEDADLYRFAEEQHNYYAERGFIVDQSNGDEEPATQGKRGGKF